MRPPELSRGIDLTVLAIVLLLALPSVAASQSAVVSVPGTAQWTNTQLDVTEGDFLVITAAGSWKEGDTISGPAGIEKPWPDNFFNFADLGMCMYCAKTATPHFGALIGYIGDRPPAPGSYTNAAVFPEIAKIFLIGEDYAAAAPATGRLWLNKNTDAYSNYTVDNSGAVEAAVAMFPPETEAQYMNRAQAAAASIDFLTPRDEAASYCVRAAFDHWQKQVMKYMLKAETCGPKAVDPLLWNTCSLEVDLTWFVGMATEDLLKIHADFSNGRAVDTTWDIGRLVYRVISLHPGKEGELFGWLGWPAFQCTMAGLWYTGEIGGQLGQLIRDKVQPPATTEASIAGDWALTRSAPLDCVNFKNGCQSTPIRLRVDPCSATECTITRSDGVWNQAHTIRRSGTAWVGDFDDMATICNDRNNVDHFNVARIGIRFSVTNADGGQARAVGGFYEVHAATNPPDCAGNAYSRWSLYGSR